MTGLIILSLACAWCGGMSAMMALIQWRDNEPWWGDAVFAMFGLSMAVLWAFMCVLWGEQ